MAKFYLLKVSVLTLCLVGALGMPNQSQNNEKPVNDDQGDAQNNNGNGNHPAGKNECAGNSRKAEIQLCNDGEGICWYRDDKYGNDGHKECVGYCSDAPTTPEHATIVSDYSESKIGDNIEGAIITFTCTDDSEPTSTDLDIQCLSSGEWEKPNFECRRKCGVPTAESPRTVESSTGIYEGDVAITGCEGETLAIGGTTLTCTYNSDTQMGEWVGDGSCVDVCDVNDLASSYNQATPDDDAEFYTLNGVVSYSCNDGYSGCVTATCGENGLWGYAGSCKKTCDVTDLQTVNNADYSADAAPYFEGGVVVYTCDADSQYSGCVTATCSASGTWEYSGQCKKVCDATSKPSVANADLTTGSNLDIYYVESTIVFECQSGYTGNGYLECAAGGTWTQVGGCEQAPHDCGTPTDTVDYATQTTNPVCDTTEGAQVAWSCDNSEATVTLTCDAIDGWTTTDPDCPAPSGASTCGPADSTMGGLDLDRDETDATSGTLTAYYGPCDIGSSTYLKRVCDSSTNYEWEDQQPTTCPDTDGQPCDVSTLTNRANDNNGYLYEGCCYYATQAEKNLDGDPAVSTNAVAYCNVYGTLAGAELAVAQTQDEADFISTILANQNLADEIWSGLKYVGGQWIDVTTELPATVFNLPIDETEGSIVGGICLGIRTSNMQYFTTECSRASHKHKAICQVCPTP